MLPTDAKERKSIPVATGCLDYFPDALCAVAELSRIGNDQHNPDQPLHWAKEKSSDHADCIVRHLIERGTVDTDGVRHSTKVAWRALANLQIELEAAADVANNPVTNPGNMSGTLAGVYDAGSMPGVRRDFAVMVQGKTVFLPNPADAVAYMEWNLRGRPRTKTGGA
jgi:hypothetical protein